MVNENTTTRPASYEHLFEHNLNGGRSFRLGFLAAIAIHLAIFAVTWPTLARTQGTRPETITVRRFPVVQFREPPPSDQRFTAPPRRVPIPDPDPQGPELITKTVPENVTIPFPEETLPFFPEAPPTTEESDSPVIVEAGIEVSPPRALHRVQPQYSEAARRIRFEGAVVLSLLIDTEGKVADVGVLRSLPFGLTENAVAAARQWRFEPCIYNKKPVSVRMVLTVQFRIAS